MEVCCLRMALIIIEKNYHVREFENKAKKFFKSKNALAVTSGTAAIK